MGEVTVTQFAAVLKVPVDKLITQLDQAGISVSGPEDVISEEAKLELLTHLRRSHGAAAEGQAPARITLKRKTQSELKLASTQGRARTVNVEVRRKHTYVKREALEEQARVQQEQLDQQKREAEAAQKAQLEKVENERRERERMELENRRRVEEEQARKRLVEETRRAADQRTIGEGDRPRRAAEEPKREEPARAAHAPAADGEEARARHGRQELHIQGDVSARHKKKKRVKSRSAPSELEPKHAFEKPTAPIKREIGIGEAVTVADLAQKMAVKATEVIKVLMNMGVMATINQPIDQDTAVLVIEEFGNTAKIEREDQIEENLQETDSAVALETRAPVVTVMGHVDHGKTSLLDYIRTTKVAAGEAGGITQHVGAYHVQTPRGMVTFLDTPGHAAFTAMRARGAKVTDVVVLVVAADDGVMPQTIEAIQHAKAAGVPLVVAVNKVDKSDADPERVRNELAKQEVIPEEWGGQNIFVNVSARTGEGVDKLLEAILLQAEILELKAPREGLATAFVVESSMEKGRGAVVTALVKKGTLRLGDAILAGGEYGRVRAMFDEAGNPLTEATPSVPVVVLGLSGAPNAGEELLAVENEKKAREVALYRQSKSRDSMLHKGAQSTEDVFSKLGEAKVGIVPLLIKADVQGSAEALRDALNALSTDEVQVRVIRSGVGGITASDVQLAAASKARIIGFNVRADSGAREAVKETGVEIRYYSIIYEAIDDVKQQLSGLLAPEIRDQIVGVAQVRDVFRSSKFGVVAGCLVTEGAVKRNNPIRVLRESVVIFEGALESLRRFKDDVGEVRAGTECGIGVKNYQDVRVGDQIECYSRIEIIRTIQ
ncbi:MAG: translation initiation factor IF-2 [Steroidobacteraceae bacterium]|jgi:translation initiation factor IF-2